MLQRDGFSRSCVPSVTVIEHRMKPGRKCLYHARAAALRDMMEYVDRIGFGTWLGKPIQQAIQDELGADCKHNKMPLFLS